MSVGKLARLDLREVWPHEAHDFSRWLESNIEVLGDVLGIQLTATEREASAGSFNADLLAEDEDGRPVIIENQLSASDHDHLGKLLTYAAALDAKAAVWIVERPRPEHVKVIAWLNETMPTLFYLVQVEAVRIGDSEPAALLTKIVGPSLESLLVGEVKKELSERHKLRRAFWTQLLDHARSKTRLHTGISPQTSNWIATGAGLSGLYWSYVVLQNTMRVELYIDRGEEAENLRIFDTLVAQKGPIETSYGAPLDWQRLDQKRGCRIADHLEGGGWRDQDRWASVAASAVEAMIRLEAAIRPYLRGIKEAARTRLPSQDQGD